MDAIHLPRGGRAPGWGAGIVIARRQLVADNAEFAARLLLRRDVSRVRSSAKADPRKR